MDAAHRCYQLADHPTIRALWPEAIPNVHGALFAYKRAAAHTQDRTRHMLEEVAQGLGRAVAVRAAGQITLIVAVMVGAMVGLNMVPDVAYVLSGAVVGGVVGWLLRRALFAVAGDPTEHAAASAVQARILLEALVVERKGTL